MDLNAAIFDLEAVFDPEDYMFFYGDSLNDERTDREVGFMEEKLGLKKGQRILDLACGHGRHANALAARGYSVTGFDYIQGFLDMAQKDAEEKKLQVEYVHGDMRQLPYDSEFDRVVLAFTAFGYFVDEENELVLRNICRALKPGGMFCFDLINRDMFLKNFRAHMVMEKQGNFMIDKCRFDSITGRNYNSRTVIRDGVIKKKPFFVRMYNYTEIRSILYSCGFEIIESYGSWDGSVFDSDSFRMIIVTQKKSD